MLRAKEVALVLRGCQTPDVVKRVRERMRDGVYGEALKVDGVLQLPLVALAEYIRPRPEPPPIPRRLPGEPMKPQSGVVRRLVLTCAKSVLARSGQGTALPWA